MCVGEKLMVLLILIVKANFKQFILFSMFPCSPPPPPQLYYDKDNVILFLSEVFFFKFIIM